MRGWVLSGLLLMGAVACEEGEPERREPVVVDGERVPPEVLRKGEFLYMRWCAGCHGPQGRGDGRRARAAERPPPDFASGEWRRVDVAEGELPPDAYFRGVIRRGIDGTIMEPMPVPEEDLGPLITYVKHLATRR